MELKLIQGKQIATASWAVNALTASYLDGYTSPFPFTGSAQITGSLGVTGSLNVSQGITGSLFGTSSWAQNSISSSYPLTLAGTTLRSTATTAISIGGATTASNSNFLGAGAGNSATNANNSNFFGQSAGAVTNANNSNFFGQNAGYLATSASNSNFFGQNTGYSATSASNSNFFGNRAGYSANSASYSNLLGYQVGYNTIGGSIGSNNIIIGTNITLGVNQKDSINLGGIIFATGSYSTAAGNPFSGSVTGAKVGIGTSTPQYTLDISGSLNVTQGITGSLFGTASFATSASFAVSSSRAVTSSFAISSSQAQNSISSSYPLAVNGTSLRSIYVNGGSGASTTGSIYIGGNTGISATNASYSNFFGSAAGYQATNANNSNFLGSEAGSSATSASNSNFFGQSAGTSATNASFSTLVGYRVGYDPAGGSNSIGSNNIIIGTHITLTSQRKDSINLGGIIFATGSYSTTAGNPYSGSQYGIGRVGINVTNPTHTLTVGGTVAFPNLSNNFQNYSLYYNNGTGEVTYASPGVTTAATVAQINTPDGTTIYINPKELEQSKYTTHNIYNNLNFT